MTSLAPPRAAPRDLIVFAGLAVLVASCQLPPEPERQIFVDAAFGFSGSESDAYLPLGDVDTLFAQASAGVFLPELLCDSRTAPSCFTFSSSNSAVATIDTAGIVTTRGTGTTLLRVNYKRTDTTSVRLTVTPAAVALRATPESVDVAVGDSIAVTITALDSNGESVAGVLFDFEPDTTYWAVTSPPREDYWHLATPIVLHLRANLVGSVRLTAMTVTERPAGVVESRPVVVRVHAR